jgi:hypothetical protein
MSEKNLLKIFFFSDEIREARSCVVVTACAINPFTEQNAEFLYRE